MLTPEAELSVVERRQHETSKSNRCDGSLRRGSSDSTMTRMRRATGEALLAPSRNRRSIEKPYNRQNGKSVERREGGGRAQRTKRELRLSPPAGGDGRNPPRPPSTPPAPPA